MDPDQYNPGSDYNAAYHTNIINNADNNARNAYQQTLAETGRQDLALRQAQFEWKKTLDEAGLTGYYQNNATVPYLTQSAQMFGTWGVPQQGQQTLESQAQAANMLGTYQGQQTLTAQQQAFQQAYNLANQYGQYYAPGQTPTAGLQTQQAQQQQFAQGLQNRQFDLARETQRQQTAQGYLNLLSQLRGPADWTKYQQVMAATPQGMRDLTGAAMGDYVPGQGTSGQQPQAANLQTMQQQVQGLGNGTNTGGAQQQNQMNLPAPNQFAPATWNAMNPSQKSMILGQYEAQGWYKPDVEAMLGQSTSKYASNAPTAGTWRLQ